MATLTERLVEAEAAYHDLQIGKAVVRVRDSNGEEVTYNQTTRLNLRAYIEDLKLEIAGSTCRITGPMRVDF